MEEYRELAAAIPPFVRYVLTTLEAAGFEAYCVGGCVRDLLLRRTPGDWDMTTSARPEQTMALFGNCALPTGLKHGTVTVCSGMNRVETTTFRTDGAYADHRHPEQVTFTDSLQEDLSRRDFTVNAMAMELAGRLHDPFHGREDLKNGVLRCVGEPEKRFSEDALRILRCLRFAGGAGLHRGAGNGGGYGELPGAAAGNRAGAGAGGADKAAVRTIRGGGAAALSANCGDGSAGGFADARL